MPKKPILPEMPLCNGCGACCGPVSARPAEAKVIRQYMREHGVEWQKSPHAPGTLDFACGFLRKQPDDTYICAIHPVRPWSCRAFGVIKEMTCPLFPEAAKDTVPPKEAVGLRLLDPDDKYLGEYFEPNYLKRIGGRGFGVALKKLAMQNILRTR